MADDVTDEKPKAPVTPLGAQVMRSLRRGLKGVIDQHTEMSGPLDDCGAKSDIGAVIGGLGEHTSSLEKAWAKYYKEHDIDAEDPAPEEMKADDPAPEGDADDDDDSELSDDDIDAALAALDDDAGEDADAPTEKSEPVDEDDDERMVMKKRQLESRIKRLERLAAE